MSRQPRERRVAATARRAGWVGCNFDLRRIPAEARIAVVSNSQITPAREVREKFQHVKPLQQISVKERGWTLDVLNIVQRVVGTDRRAVRPTKEFTNAEIYAHAPELEKLHPGNRHIKDKIRQQLQALRDRGFLT